MLLKIILSAFYLLTPIHSVPVKQALLTRVPRAVFDLIPRHHQTKVFISGSPCPCPDTGGECILDADLECRKTLQILPSKAKLFSAHYKRHRRNKLKKLFKKWIQQGGQHS